MSNGHSIGPASGRTGIRRTTPPVITALRVGKLLWCLGYQPAQTRDREYRRAAPPSELRGSDGVAGWSGRPAFGIFGWESQVAVKDLEAATGNGLDSPDSSRRWRDWPAANRALIGIVGTLVVLSFAVRGIGLGTANDIFIDELTYTELGRSIARGELPNLHGAPFLLHPPRSVAPGSDVHPGSRA